MKMSELQKHYKKSFDKLRRYYNGNAKYSNPHSFSLSTSIPNKQIKRYAKYLNIDVIMCSAKHQNIKAGLRTTSPYLLDIEVTINNIPCLITFSMNEMHSISMGYNRTAFALDTYSCIPNSTNNSTVNVLNSTVRFDKFDENNNIQFRNSNYPYSKNKNRDIENALNDLISTYNITDAPITEEQEFQLSTVVDNPQYYIPVYQRAYHIIKGIENINSTDNKPSVLQIMRLAAGL